MHSPDPLFPRRDDFGAVPWDGFSISWPVQMLANHFLRSIQSWMKDICVIPLHYVFLEFLWNYYFIFVHDKFYSILASAKITLLIFCRIKFFCWEGVFPLIAVYFAE